MKLQKFNLIGEKYIKNKAFSCMLDENRKDELQNLEERNFTSEDDRPTQNRGSIGAVIYVNYGSHLSHSTANQTVGCCLVRRKVSQAFLNASHRKKFENH